YRSPLPPSTRGCLTMTFYAELTRATASERQHLLAAPLITSALNDTISLTDYVAFLTQAYHHVKHTVPLLMATCARLPDSADWLPYAVSEHIEKELVHHKLILNDIGACGFDR